MTTSGPIVLNDRYTLDRAPLGRGGMGEVWGGHDAVLGRRVAVKLVRLTDVPDDLAELERRFLREARVMARLGHPGAPAIHDAGVSEDASRARRMFIVMEYVDGIRLDDVIAETETVPLGWAAAIGAQVAAVLAAAHAKGVLHRDLKPSNLILCPDGAVKVIDFGLALLHDPDVSKLTRSGAILGTALYMPPEQVRSETATARSDLYALGCVLYEMIAGCPPFVGDTEYAILEQQVGAKPTPLADFRAEVPPDLADLVAELLAKDPSKRPADAAVVHRRLLQYVSGARPLPGMADQVASPRRMYADVLTRILHRSAGDMAKRVPGTDDAPRVSRTEMSRARREAAAMAREGRHAEAVQVLEAVIEPGGRPLTVDDPDAVKLRMYYANILADAGDRRAAGAFLRLGDDLAERFGAEDERVVQCRLGEADCHARLGDDGLALRLLRGLLADQLAVRSGDDPRVLELRRRVGELEDAVGEHDAARRTLADLHDDLSREAGSDHPSATRVRDRLERLGP
ncbi:serine/threonine-protein kinase [Actinomadura bangladeshensis]|uniref:serine/threonine-protein kinase n=1 Tax=Actinomadura bangladeshensis TaxID=453573 RepID=UPI001404E6F9|nr:serine/threonine-protein kinase [Actinomadura bangladeshensis]